MLKTIESIKESLGEVDKALKTFIVKHHREENFGDDKAYNAESLKNGLKFVLGELRALTKAHNKFANLSIWEERQNIVAQLNGINDSLSAKDYDSVARQLDGLKVIVRQYNYRTSSESEDILGERANNLHGICAKLEEKTEEIERAELAAQEVVGKIKLAEEKYASLDEQIHQLQERFEEASSLYAKAQKNEQQISGLLANAESEKKVLALHAKRIGEREAQLDEQKQKTEQYDAHLAEYQEQHVEIQEKVKKLTEKAEEALRSAATVGIGGAIHERYREERGKHKWNLFWLLGGAAFAGLAMALGYSMVIGHENITLGAAVARIAIISVAISAAWFCAFQYVRHRNTLEDYGYKSVLARSIIAFLDQFEDPAEREHYLKTVLKEIHQDPLRKRHDVDVPAWSISSWFKKRKSRQGNSSPNDMAD